jgi:hypothetical protein
MKKDTARGQTRHLDGEGPWYSLDNAGIIMPSVSDRVTTNLFRLSATLVEPVDLAVLRSALDAVSRRFPYFVVELRRGLFWHYLVPKPEGLRIEGDSRSPMQGYDVNARHRGLVRVRVEGRRVACEFHHSIADGTGGLRFLKNLVAEYARRRWPESAPAPSPSGPAWGDPDLYRLEERPAADEYEDAYRRHCQDEYPAPAGTGLAWAPRMTPLRRFEYRITCGTIPLDRALAAARERGASLTELLAAVYIDAFQELWLASPPGARRRSLISLSIPVNMRKLYPSATNRNFSLVTFLTQDMRLGARELDDIVKRAHHQLRFETDARTMGRQIARNVAAAKSLAFRLLPLPAKDLAFKVLYFAFGEGLYSGSISNLGEASLPPWLAPRVERLDFQPSPTKGRTNVAVLSYKGELRISFGSLDSSREIERLFFTRLRKLGLPVRIECNL